MLFAFDLGVFMARFAQASPQMVGHCAHMAARTAGCHDHEIRQAGFTCQINGDQIDGFVVFEGVLDEFEKFFAVKRLPDFADYGLILSNRF